MGFIVNPYRFSSFVNTYAGSLDGVDEYFNVPTSTTLNAGSTNTQLSVFIWSRKNSASSGTVTNLMNRENGGASGWFISHHTSGGGKIRVGFDTDNSGTYEADETIDSTTAVSFDAWHHIGFTFSSGAVIIYVDGASNGTFTTPETTIPADTDPFRIGARGDGSQFFHGIVDEISYWDKALSGAEVTELYNSGVPTNLLTHSATSNLVSWWRFDNDADDLTATTGTLKDNKGTNHATPINTESTDKVTTVP